MFQKVRHRSPVRLECFRNPAVVEDIQFHPLADNTNLHKSANRVTVAVKCELKEQLCTDFRRP